MITTYVGRGKVDYLHNVFARKYSKHAVSVFNKYDSKEIDHSMLEVAKNECEASGLRGLCWYDENGKLKEA